MLIKALFCSVSASWPCRNGRREALLLAATMAMGGEFAFVVFSDSVKFGLIDAIWRDRLVAVVGISIALTPLILMAIQAWYQAQSAENRRAGFRHHRGRPSARGDCRVRPGRPDRRTNAACPSNSIHRPRKQRRSGRVVAQIRQHDLLR